MRDDGGLAGRKLVEWGIPLVAGILLAIAAARLGNPLVPIGTSEVLTAFALGAVLKSGPFRIGLLLVVPAAACVLVARSDSFPRPILTVLLFAFFALFNGLFAAAGASWAADISRRHRPPA